MNYVFTLLAWLGGRSFDELRDKTGHDCGTSIAVGGFSVVSACMIAAGQYLFWSHLPHTADSAPWITAMIAPLYLFFYRNLIRAQEVMNGFGKCLTFLVAGVFIGINALLAGHELVLLAFRPQVEAQVAFDAATGLTQYAAEVENSLALPRLRNDSKTVHHALSAAQAERARVPDSVLSLQKQTQQCDGIASNFQSRIPADPETTGYAAAMSAWREQRSRCNTTRAQADRMVREHRKHTDDQIAGLSTKRKTLDQKLDDVTAEYDANIKREAPSIKASATSGFARHKALWAAVAAGRIPAWATYGLMFIALLLEGMSFIIKFLLPADTATLERQHDAELDCAFGEMRVFAARSYRANIRSAVAGMAPEFSADVKQDARNIVVPGMRTEMATRVFDYAHASVDSAQRRARKAAPDLLRRLASLSGAVRGTTSPRPAGSM